MKAAQTLNTKLISKQSARTELKTLVWNIRRALLDKRSYLIVHSTHKFCLEIVKKLYLSGTLEGYEKKGKYLFIKLPTLFTLSAHSTATVSMSSGNISNLPTPRHGGVSYKAKTLQKFQRLGGHHKTGYFNTDLGFVEGSLAASRQIGGTPVFQVR